MRIESGSCVLRPYHAADRERLAILANDMLISRNMTAMFPYPYTDDDADQWIRRCIKASRPWENLAVEVDGEYSGGIGLHRGSGEKHRVAQMGYWIEPSLWGRGIMTDAARAFTSYAFDTFPVDRLQATVFGWNAASARVLVKCGFVEEGRLRAAIARFGETTDELIFGLLRSDHEAAD